MQIRVIKGSIFRLKYVDAIVNITNKNLNSNYVIDKEIHKREDLNKLNASIPYKAASAVIADATRIASKKVIHSVFPDSITAESKRQISACFENIFQLSNESQLKSIAMPLSKDVFENKNVDMMRLLFDAVKLYNKHTDCAVDTVFLVALSSSIYDRYSKVLEKEDKGHSLVRAAASIKIDDIDYDALKEILLRIKRQLIRGKRQTGVRGWIEKQSDEVLSRTINEKNGEALLSWIFSDGFLQKRILHVIYGKIEKILSEQGIYLRIDNIAFEKGMRIKLSVKDVDYSDFVMLGLRELSKSRNVYESQMLPIVLTICDNEISDSVKSKILEKVINSVPDDVRDKAVSDFCEELGVSFKISHLSCVIGK